MFLKKLAPVAVLITLLLARSALGADWLNRLGLGRKSDQATTPVAATALTQDQMVGGLKEALGKGVQQPLPRSVKRMASSMMPR